jgi:hypothetical protein
MAVQALDIEDLCGRLAAAAGLEDIPERHLRVAAVLTQALETVDVHPILVGGGAVEFYTGGGYATGDIDMVAPEGKDTAVILSGLGFDKRGKNWIHESLQLFVEFPNSNLRPGEEFITVVVDDVQVRMVSPEDLVVERLKAFKLYGATVDAANALLIMAAEPRFDMQRAARRASKEDVRYVFDGVQAMLQRFQRGMGAEDGNAMVEALREKIRR